MCTLALTMPPPRDRGRVVMRDQLSLLVISSVCVCVCEVIRGWNEAPLCLRMVVIVHVLNARVKPCPSCSPRRPTFGCRQQKASASSPVMTCFAASLRHTQIRESRRVVFLFHTASERGTVHELPRLNHTTVACNYDRVTSLRLGFHRSAYSLRNCFHCW